MGHEGCVNRAQFLFRDWMIYISDPRAGKINPNLKSIVFCTAIRHGDKLEWNFLFEQLLTTKVASEKTLMLASLGCSSKKWLLSSYLEMTLDEKSPIKKQDGNTVFNAVASNIDGADIALNFLFNNWDTINA